MTEDINKETIDEAANLLVHRVIARALRRDPSVLDRARVRLAEQGARYRQWDFASEWRDVLAMPSEEIGRLLLDRGERMCRLRLASPFQAPLGSVDLSDEATRRRVREIALRFVVARRRRREAEIAALIAKFERTGAPRNPLEIVAKMDAMRSDGHDEHMIGACVQHWIQERHRRNQAG